MTVVGYVAADVGDRAPEEVVELVVGAGYDALDWTMEQYDPLTAGSSALAALAERARSAGLATPQLMVHQDYVTPDPALWEERVARTERAVDAAAEAQIASIGVVTGPNRWVEGYARIGRDVDEPRAWHLAVTALERVLAHAESAGVTVSLEPCWGTLAHDAFRTDRLLEVLDHPRLGVTLDPSHFVLSGDDIAALPERWADRLAHVHLKDAFGVAGTEGEDFCFLLPGEGRVPWPALFAGLSRIGYEGPMCVEYEAFALLDGALRGDLPRAAALAREFVGGLLSSVAG